MITSLIILHAPKMRSNPLPEHSSHLPYSLTKTKTDGQSPINESEIPLVPTYKQWDHTEAGNPFQPLDDLVLPAMPAPPCSCDAPVETTCSATNRGRSWQMLMSVSLIQEGNTSKYKTVQGHMFCCTIQKIL